MERGNSMNQQIVDSAAMLPFWNKLTETEKSLIINNSMIQKFQHNTVIYHGDDGKTGFFLILKGIVRASMISNKGREITLYRLNPGDFCSLSPCSVISQITFDTLLTSVSGVEALKIEPYAFTHLLATNINVRCFFFELVANRFSQVMWLFQQILFWGVDKRIASYFISEYNRSGKPIIRMTQEELSVEINTAREVVARMLTRFVKEKVIEANRGEIRLLDMERLKMIANS